MHGHVLRHLKKDLWIALEQIRQTHISLWILCGDFNVIKHKKDNTGSNFDISLSREFNIFINKHSLVEHTLQTRKFTWSNGRNFPLLDRIFTSLSWNTMYPNSSIQDLHKSGSDNCLLLF